MFGINRKLILTEYQAKHLERNASQYNPRKITKRGDAIYATHFRQRKNIVDDFFNIFYGGESADVIYRNKFIPNKKQEIKLYSDGCDDLGVII